MTETEDIERKAKRAAYMRAWRAKNPPLLNAKRKAKAAEKMRKWRKQNPLSAEKKAKEAARAKQWRDANPEKYRDQQNGWYAKNRERILAKDRERRRARKQLGPLPSQV
ncbi:hypothetical protein HQ945_05125 [Phyllobacterium sp. BT25]|uniref:Uncharacterized protein n=1 Tax=Phyllobacterium pellucidum TaxID=2740464 RepID=A0A849VPE7_9HYPH|nr:hypothetical protein [Phyllobacterium pellucidum]NTS30629.1 hypothetical protein [Phyllobacterium pellucidum]